MNTKGLPVGAIIGHVNLVDCIRIVGPRGDGKIVLYEHGFVEQPESDFGNYEPGRFAWKLENPVAYPEPIPWKGKLGIWKVYP